MYIKSAMYLSSLLRSIVSATEIPRARQTHVQLLVNGFFSDVTLQTDVLRAYTKCGLITDARKTFDKMPQKTMHSWNMLIFSYVHSSMHFLAFSLFLDEFRQMGLRPDHYTLPPLFKSCVGIGDPFLGGELYGLAIKLGLRGCVFVGSAFLDFSLKCGALLDAKRAFAEMPLKDVVTWNSMISGLGRSGLSKEALICFRQMITTGMSFDSITIPSVLNACGGEGDLISGREIHAMISKTYSHDTDLAIGNSLIDMYAKCGCLEDAEEVFKSMKKLNLVTLTTMISSYGLHGKGEDSLFVYRKMIHCGFRPNHITLTAILASCSHSGLLDEARKIFHSISLDYGFEPSVEHYACMVDLLGRLEHLKEALGLAKSSNMPSVWGALLAGCLIHKNVEIGEIAAHQLFELEPRNSSNYIALCRIYESHCMWDRICFVRSKMKELGLVKTPAHSWIVIPGTTYKFYQADPSHPQTELLN